MSIDSGYLDRDECSVEWRWPSDAGRWPGRMGLFSNALTKEATAEFSSVVFGPQMLRREFAEIFFSDDEDSPTGLVKKAAERRDLPILLTLKTPSNSSANHTTSDSEIDLGQNGNCFRNFTQNLETPEKLTAYWVPSNNLTEVGQDWFIIHDTLQSQNGRKKERTINIRWPICDDVREYMIRASLRLSAISEGGILLRLNDRLHYEKISLVKTNENRISVIFSTVINGEEESLREEVANGDEWIMIAIVDTGTEIRVAINQNKIFTRHTVRRTLPIKNYIGLISMEGVVTIRDFSIEGR